MKALVTGATGFVGSFVAELLVERGFDVRCFYRKSSNTRWFDGKPYELVEASLSDPESLVKAVQGVDYIFHIAGATFARNYDEFLKSNRDGTKNLIETAMKYNPNLKRFLHTSSQTAAGPSPSLESPIDETAPCHPLTAYGKSKREGELVVLSKKDNYPITIVRPPAVTGPRDPGLIQVFQMVNGGLAATVGLSTKYLSLIYSEDLVRGIVDAATTDKTVGETYFISSEQFYTWDYLINSIKNALGKQHVLRLKVPDGLVLTAAWFSEFFGKFASKPPIFNYDKGIDFVQKYWTCSVEKAKRDFGYRQLVDMQEGLNRTVKWYSDNKWL